jgi:hypothetical protein
LPTRNRNVDDIEDFVRAHVDEVDRIWRGAIATMMKTIDRDPAGTFAREMGVAIPPRPAGLPPAAVLEKQLPGAQYVDESQFIEGRDFEAV